MTQITILGSGMSALGAAHKAREMGILPTLYDKSIRIGGHTKSVNVDGFIFDEGPHVSFTKDERIKSLLAEVPYNTIHAKVDNYWNGHRIKHPVITNMYGLPDVLVTDIIADFYKEKQTLVRDDIVNFEQWLVASYGRKYAETFPMQYGKKYHTTDTKNLNTDHVGPRLYQADAKEILLGALHPVTPDVHYIQEYRYPTHGGFQSYVDHLSKGFNINGGYEIISIDTKQKKFRFQRVSSCLVGEMGYEKLISSLPLDTLIGLVEDVPDEVMTAMCKLACTYMLLINIGVDRPDISDSSWSYSYDEDVPFTRLSFPHNMSQNTVPNGKSSVQAEIYFSRKYKKLNHSDVYYEKQTVEALERYGILRQGEKLYVSTQMVSHANVIYDMDRTEAVNTIHAYLDGVGIGYCGRYGEWNHAWTDESFISGENAVEKLMK